MMEEKESDLNDFDLYGYTTTLLSQIKIKLQLISHVPQSILKNTESAIQANEQLSSKNPNTNTEKEKWLLLF